MLELISWRDACDWRGSGDRAKKLKLPLVHSVGEVINETADIVLIRYHFHEPEEDAFQIDAEEEGIAIPKSWIVKRQVLHQIQVL